MTKTKMKAQSGTTSLKPIRMIQLGLGLHSARTIVPHVHELERQGLDASVKVAVDLESSKPSVIERAEKLGDAKPEEIIFISPDSTMTIDSRTELLLNRLVKKHDVNTASVSVPPEAHFPYAMWALRQNLSVNLDKPITTRTDSVNSLSAARGIIDDYEELMNESGPARQRAAVCVSLNAQRPFMPVYATLLDRISEVVERTGQPVTNVTACQADGQARFGSEIIDIAYHGYRNGVGKVSHSGYHLLDMVCRILKVGTLPDQRPDYLIVRSSFRQPDALVVAMPRSSWRALFEPSFGDLEGYTDAELIELGRRMGEVDAHISIDAIRNGAILTTINIHLQHDTVAARSTLCRPDNLYKGSGRLKRELWHVDQGLMQSMRIETIQAEDKHDNPGAKGDNVGDPNHLELVCVRNDQLVGSGQRIERLMASDLAGSDQNRLHSEQGKMAALSEFAACVQGRLHRAFLTSDLSVHRLGVHLMSAAYESHILRGTDRMSDGSVLVEWAE